MPRNSAVAVAAVSKKMTDRMSNCINVCAELLLQRSIVKKVTWLTE